jgi:hypothetical protein
MPVHVAGSGTPVKSLTQGCVLVAIMTPQVSRLCCAGAPVNHVPGTHEWGSISNPLQGPCAVIAPHGHDAYKDPLPYQG